MKSKLSTTGWVFLLMIGVSFCGYSFIKMLNIQDYMLQNGLGTILLGLPAVLYLIFQEKPNKEKVRFHLLSWKAVVLLFIIAIALEMVTIEINIATSFIFSNYTTDVITGDVLSSSLLLSIICIAVLPAVFEELSFRGAFFQEYRAAYGAWPGILLSGFLFGIYHMNMRQFVYAFLCGIFFALLIEATDSIAASMLLHFLMNLISCLAIYATRNIPQEEAITETAQQQYLLMQLLSFFPIAMMGLLILILCYIGLAKSCGRYSYIKELFSWKNIVSGKRIGSMENIAQERTPWKWLFSIPLIIGVMICLGVILMIEIRRDIF